MAGPGRFAGLPRVNSSVFIRAVGIAGATAAIVAGFLAWQAMRLSGQLATEDLHRYAEEATNSLAFGIGPAIRFKKPADIADRAEGAIERSNGVARKIVVFDATGAEILARGSATESEQAVLLSLISESLANTTEAETDDGLALVRLVRDKDESVIGGIATAWTDAPARARIASASVGIALKAVAVFVALAAVAAYLMRASISLPLRRVAEAMDGVASADYQSTIPETHRGDEIGKLARNLDGMRAALAKADAVSQAAAREQHEQTLIVQRMGSALEDLGRGDFTVRIDEAFPPSYEALRSDVNRLAEALERTISDVALTSHRIRGGTEGLRRSSEDLSRRTENQAATLEQSVAAVEELTGSLRAAAEDTRHVAEGVGRTRTQASEGQGVVEEAVAAMAAIRQSSDQISRIIGVIDDIAFQTNLLALNAGVEAARAGDAGRGFSVVASEVRALAQRTSESAREIKGLIQTAAEEVMKGVDLVDRTGAALTRITSEVQSVAGLAEGLAAAISNQSAGLNEISLGLSQLDQVTQQNAGMVEQTAHTQASLHAEAEALGSAIARFQIRRSGIGADGPGTAAQDGFAVRFAS